MTESGGTLHDAIAEAVHRHFFYTTGKADAMDESYADAVLDALKEHLAEHPADIEELGWHTAGTQWFCSPRCWSADRHDEDCTYEPHFRPPAPPIPPIPSIPGEDAQ